MAEHGENSGVSGCRVDPKGKAKIVIKLERTEEEELSELTLCLIAKLWTLRKFNGFAFMNTMEKIWNPNHSIESKAIGAILFLIHWKDMDKVIDGEP